MQGDSLLLNMMQAIVWGIAARLPKPSLRRTRQTGQRKKSAMRRQIIWDHREYGPTPLVGWFRDTITRRSAKRYLPASGDELLVPAVKVMRPLRRCRLMDRGSSSRRKREILKQDWIILVKGTF